MKSIRSVFLLTIMIVASGCTGTHAQSQLADGSNSGPIAKGRSVGGAQLAQILPGSTLYGYFVRVDAKWVEHYSEDGHYFVQFSPALPDKYGLYASSVEGTWQLRGNLLCYHSFNIGFEDSCAEVYEKDGIIQFADAATGEIVAVSTRTDWAVAATPLAPSESTPAKKSSAAAEGASGTGFVVSMAGHILTNHHVIESCREFEVSSGSTKASASLLAFDAEADLAVLKTQLHFDHSAVFRIGKLIRPGDEVIAIGFPLRGLLSDEPIVTEGSVSAMAGIGGDRRMMQITAPVQPGSSGGPLLEAAR
jgi:hypothetical protein